MAESSNIIQELIKQVELRGVGACLGLCRAWKGFIAMSAVAMRKIAASSERTHRYTDVVNTVLELTGRITGAPGSGSR